MAASEHGSLIHDWNAGEYDDLPGVHLNDETLRDGLQSPSVTIPSTTEKIAILTLMEELGIEGVNIGLAAAGPWAEEACLALATEIARSRMKIYPNCAGRTMVGDIEPIDRVCQKAGIPIEVAMFIGSSEIRQFTEDWSVDQLVRHTETAMAYCAKNHLPVMYVTEDTTRARPETIRRLYSTAIQMGAQRICVSDTVGHATPHGAYKLIRFMRDLVKETTGDERSVKIDWHGHRDRGLAIPNALAAYKAGADRLHGTALGIGERCGNTELDLMLVNLKLMGKIDRDLHRLKDYCYLVSRACRVPIPQNYPVVGSDAFETGTGVHAAAVIKAMRKGDEWLANRVYSSVPADDFGLRQRIVVGPMSGRSNVIYWLESRGFEADDAIVTAIFDAAKKASHALSDEQIEEVLRVHGQQPQGSAAADGGEA